MLKFAGNVSYDMRLLAIKVRRSLGYRSVSSVLLSRQERYYSRGSVPGEEDVEIAGLAVNTMTGKVALANGSRPL